MRICLKFFKNNVTLPIRISKYLPIYIQTLQVFNSVSSIYKMYHSNKQNMQISWPMPQRAWANFKNYNHFFPLSHSCFVYCLCTILPRDCWIDSDTHIIFSWTIEINAKWIFAMNLISSNLYIISLLGTFP